MTAMKVLSTTHISTFPLCYSSLCKIMSSSELCINISINLKFKMRKAFVSTYPMHFANSISIVYLNNIRGLHLRTVFPRGKLYAVDSMLVLKDILMAFGCIVVSVI